MRRLLVTVIIAIILPLPGVASAQEIESEVYRDENIVVLASVVELENRTIGLGDNLSLVVEIVYDSSRVRLQDIGNAFFTGAWPQSRGAYLQDHQRIQTPEEGTSLMKQRHNYRFQILGCPEGVMSCRGARQYKMPEFTLPYQLVTGEDEVADLSEIRFQPAPDTITVGSMLELDDEGELLGFTEYFPSGAYPDPLLGKVQGELYTGLIAGGVFLLLGGILMSPLSLFRRKAFIPKSRPRWEPVLEQLLAGKFEQDEKFLDELRRCLVWYCTDELGVDPFYWIKHQEEVSGKQQKDMGEYAEFKKLFVEILHSPAGQGKALLGRFQALQKKR